MKQFPLAAILLFSSFFLNAQSSGSNPIPEGFSLGSLTMPDNTTLEGYLKNNLKKNGEIIFVSSDGKKTKYDASQLSALTMGNDKYMVENNAFYKLIRDGVKMRLLRKASNSAAIQYNGSEPVAVTAGEGGYDDYFIKLVSTRKLQLVRKKDFAKLFSSICADCPTLTDDIKAGKIGFGEIEQAVNIYNTCAN
jgi:hypothetical protein